MVDFSSLPDVAWVRILSFLPLEDRSCVSQTCHILNDVFKHPSVWYKVQILLLGDLDKYKGTELMMPQRYVQMINQFGAYFQDVTLIFHGYVIRMPKECEAVISTLGKKCRLQSLKLQVSSILSHRDFSSYQPRETDLDILVSLVRNAYRLQTFVLRSWPIYPGVHSVDVLEALRSNEKLQNLQSLSLYWLSADEATWATLNAVLPDPAETVSTISQFNNLSSLCLRSTMLSNDLLLELAKSHHTPLERLGIMVTFSRRKSSSHLPNLSAASWLKLVSHAPDLAVDFTIVTRTPYVELAGLLLPEIPVASINFMRYSRCSAEEIMSITDKYHKTLHKFVDYTDEKLLDDALIAMVTKCVNLNYFVYTGELHHSTVRALASLRGKNWYYFEVNADAVITCAQPQNSPEDEDVIIRKGDDGGWCITRDPHLLESEEQRQNCLEDMVEEVASNLGQKWTPLDRHTMPMENNPGNPVVAQKFQLAGRYRHDRGVN